ADLVSDPRTAQLSEAELDALVEALATEAIETGEAATYLEVKSAPTFTYDPLPAAESTIGSILSAPIVIALFALLAGIAGVILFVLRHRRSQPEMPESA
ncbi:MAG TPA: hypothetical protein VNM40_03215, partial [Candidatus Paceibacterota bacterium]|nr:hypothetical protein [Candidatus Paceibacterota bacterium]